MYQKLTLLFLLICFCFSISFGQESSAALKDKRLTINIKKQPLGVVFKYLMETYDIPIGFEQSILDRDHNDYSFQTNLPAVGKVELENIDKSIKLSVQAERVFPAKEHLISINIANGKLSEVFDKIVNQITNYKWEINEGVVNIFPIRGRDERFKELLETKIEKFELGNYRLKINGSDEGSEELPKTKTVRDITYSIMTLKEFGGWLRGNKLHFNPARTGSSILLEAQYGRKVDGEMSFANVTFRELLNNITKVKKGGWILKWESVFNGKEYIDLDI